MTSSAPGFDRDDIVGYIVDDVVPLKHLLPSTETEHILGRIDNLVQLVFSKLTVAPSLRRVPATLLTLRKLINVKGFWHDICPDFGPLSEWESTSELYVNYSLIFRDHIRDTSSLWLCKSLVKDAEMNDTFFSDGNLYSDVALLYARTRDNGRVDGFCVENLPAILSKAAPSEELATLLTQKFLQVQRNCFDNEDEHDVESFFIAIIIYLFECGIPFLSEHQHGPGFHPHSWDCGICLLFDPFGVKCADIELSRNPDPHAAQLVDDVAQLAELNPLWRDIHRVPLLWLRTWIFWLGDIAAFDTSRNSVRPNDSRDQIAVLTAFHVGLSPSRAA
ncbi:hypothetical protein D9619_013727 [Psilocybe cf. subviscida]|uniref:Uncharacterized protein n=1 Tax=Psilocybe cf. subviscida TaxID=2480587 RepID=A0A8H5EVF8_9AGAR|nr:hypothetical protein D9619_013727 [Psilocybe cf. subviscida]